MLEKMLMYLNSFLSYFGFVTPRVRRYDIALDILSKARRNAAAITDASTKSDNETQPVTDQRETDKILLYRQIEALREYVAKYDLLHRRVGDEEQLGVLASDVVLDKNIDKIVPRLNNVESLLEIQRAVLTGKVRQVPSKGLSAEAVRPAIASTSPAVVASVSPREAVSGEQPSQASQPDEYAFLWKTTEKLYDSWPIKILGLLLIGAVLLAGSGTLMIGGKAIELRKTLEDVGERETKSFESFSKTTQDAITKQRATVLADLDRQQTEINHKMTHADQQIRDLEKRSAEIRDAAVARVAQEIRGNFPGLEKKLKDDLESELAKVKENYVHDLQEKARALLEDVGANQKLITTSGPKIKMLVDLAADVGSLKEQADSIPRAKSSAEEAHRKASDAQQSAQNADVRIQQLAKEVESRLKPQMDKIIENEGKLGSSEKSLKLLADKLENVGLDNTKIQRILDGAEHANDRLSVLKKLADDLDERIKRPPPAPPTLPKPLLTEKDLTGDQWKTIQQSLKTRGFYAGKLDGKVGTGTRGAIGKYQADRKASAGLLASDQIGDLLGLPVN
jgi:hypothetical protein